MKTIFFATALCLLPFQSVTAEEVLWGGKTYRLETVRPVQVDAYGRIVPMPPMTILVPVPVPVPVSESESVPLPVSSHQAQPTDRVAAKPVFSRTQERTPPQRVASRKLPASDVGHSLFQSSGDTSKVPSVASYSSERRSRLYTSQPQSASTMLRDSTAVPRRIY